jgi:hypothetical protein
MFRPLAVVVAFALAAPLFAQPPKADPPKKEPALKIGDPAPPLVVDKWLTGKEVKGFEKDTVYLISFTKISPPFAAALPPLVELSDRHAGKGLVVVGVHTNHGKKMSEEQVAQEVEYAASLAKELGVSYPVAWDGEKKIWDAYVGTADAVSGFVIDKAGKVAYAGPDPFAAYAAGKVLDGTWKGKADADAIGDAMAGLDKFMGELSKKLGPDMKFSEESLNSLQAELPAFEKLLKDSPFLLSHPQVAGMRLSIHMMAQSYHVPEEVVTARLAAATKRKSVNLLKDLYYTFGSAPLKPDPKLSKLVAKFTDGYAGLLDPKKAATEQYDDWSMLVVMSKKHGNSEKADTYTQSILDATPEDKRKQMEGAIKQRLKDAGVGDK